MSNAHNHSFINFSCIVFDDTVSEEVKQVLDEQLSDQLISSSINLIEQPATNVTKNLWQIDYMVTVKSEDVFKTMYALDNIRGFSQDLFGEALGSKLYLMYSVVQVQPNSKQSDFARDTENYQIRKFLVDKNSTLQNECNETASRLFQLEHRFKQIEARILKMDEDFDDFNSFNQEFRRMHEIVPILNDICKHIDAPNIMTEFNRPTIH